MNYPLDINKPPVNVKMEANRTDFEVNGPERFYRNKSGNTLCGGPKNLRGLAGQISAKDAGNLTAGFDYFGQKILAGKKEFDLMSPKSQVTKGTAVKNIDKWGFATEFSNFTLQSGTRGLGSGTGFKTSTNGFSGKDLKLDTSTGPEILIDDDREKKFGLTGFYNSERAYGGYNDKSAFNWPCKSSIPNQKLESKFFYSSKKNLDTAEAPSTPRKVSENYVTDIIIAGNQDPRDQSQHNDSHLQIENHLSEPGNFNLEIPQGLTVKKEKQFGNLLDSEDQSPVKTLDGSVGPGLKSQSVLFPRKNKEAVKPLTTYNYDEKMFDRNLAGLQKSTTVDFRNSK
jgi:hypothetical protein